MHRIKELDGIRGIAILLVLMWHYIAVQAQPRTAVQYLSLTWSGVDLFFVLSGFLIIGILLDVKGSESYFRTFYVRRACRILPLYLVVLFLYIAIPLVIQTPGKWLFADEHLPLLSYITFTQNFFMHTSGFGSKWLAATWSLAIEEQFYLLIPLVVWRLNHRQLLVVFICLICAAPIFRFIFGNLGAYVFPFARADSILMGGVLAIALRIPGVHALLSEYYKYLVGIFFVFLLGVIVLTLKLAGVGDVFTHLWLAVFFCLFICVFILRTGNPFNDMFISNSVFVWLGLRSYAIYLLHQPVSGLSHYYLNGRDTPSFSSFSEFYATVFALLIVLLLAEISYRYFETIFISYGKRFTYEKSGKDIRNTTNITPATET